MQPPKKFQTAPGFIGKLAERLNELIDFVRPFAKIEAKGGIRVTRSESNVVIDGGMPTDAQPGDMLYYGATGWVLLRAPTGSVNPVLRFNLSTSVPYWHEPEECE